MNANPETRSYFEKCSSDVSLDSFIQTQVPGLEMHWVWIDVDQRTVDFYGAASVSMDLMELSTKSHQLVTSVQRILGSYSQVQVHLLYTNFTQVQVHVLT